MTKHRKQTLLGRLDAYTLWAFNPPAHRTTRRTPGIAGR